MTVHAPGRWRCPECGRTNSPRDRFCGGCGYDDETDPQDAEDFPPQADLRIEMEGGTARKVLKQILGVWAVGYVILAILPILTTSGSGAGGAAVGGLASFIVAGVLFGPWIIGLIVLGVLYLVSPAPTPIIRRAPLLRQCPNCGHRIDPTRTWLCDQCGEPFAEEPKRPRNPFRAAAEDAGPERHDWEAAVKRPSAAWSWPNAMTPSSLADRMRNNRAVEIVVVGLGTLVVIAALMYLTSSG